jgi:hypothetical protein
VGLGSGDDHPLAPFVAKGGVRVTVAIVAIAAARSPRPDRSGLGRRPPVSPAATVYRRPSAEKMAAEQGDRAPAAAISIEHDSPFDASSRLLQVKDRGRPSSRHAEDFQRPRRHVGEIPLTAAVRSTRKYARELGREQLRADASGTSHRGGVVRIQPRPRRRRQHRRRRPAPAPAPAPDEDSQTGQHRNEHAQSGDRPGPTAQRPETPPSWHRPRHR